MTVGLSVFALIVESCPVKKKEVKIVSVKKKTESKKTVLKKTATKRAAPKTTAPKKAAPKKAAPNKKPSAKKTASKSKSLVLDEASSASELKLAKVANVDLSFIGSKDEVAETRTVASRDRVRTLLDSEVELFLKAGGKISNIAANVMGDPPRKPESNYGSRPI